ncbi:MAG TPA: trypsin-like peptidase domain-containing protein [Acidimicrobiia bacterium]
MNESRRSSWVHGPLGVLAYFVGVAAVVALVWFLYPPEPSEPETAAPTTTVPEVRVTNPGATSDEPVADAAEVILPSVVFIQTPTGVGSGVIFDDQGHVITASHVVGEHEEVRLRWSDGRLTTGRVVGSAPEVDIAVIEATPPGLPAATFNTEKPRVGQLAIAVGSPWGLAQTVTAGIVSAVDQTNCGGQTCAAMVQTDAAINPGNSGGALINRDGEVIGINVSIFTLSGANDGVGFAVPSSTVVEYANALIAGEPIPTPFLGVTIENATTERAGARVVEVAAGSAADDAGLRVGDVIIAVEGVHVFSRGDLVAQVRAHRPGETVTLDVLRGDDQFTVDVTLGERPADEDPS